MLFHSEPVKDYNLAKWIEDEARNLQIKLSARNCSTIGRLLGRMTFLRISNELNKMKLVLKEGEVLDGKSVETHIGISKEFNVFELQKALGKERQQSSLQNCVLHGKESQKLILLS